MFYDTNAIEGHLAHLYNYTADFLNHLNSSINAGHSYLISSLINLLHDDPLFTAKIQFAGVFFGAMLAGMFNYWLQNRLLGKKRKAMYMDKRIDAYFVLRPDLVEYNANTESHIRADYSLQRAYAYGSDDVKNEIQRFWYARSRDSISGRNRAMANILEIIDDEIEKHATEKRHWWHFWR